MLASAPAVGVTHRMGAQQSSQQCGGCCRNYHSIRIQTTQESQPPRSSQKILGWTGTYAHESKQGPKAPADLWSWHEFALICPKVCTGRESCSGVCIRVTLAKCYIEKGILEQTGTENSVLGSSPVQDIGACTNVKEHINVINIIKVHGQPWHTHGPCDMVFHQPGSKAQLRLCNDVFKRIMANDVFKRIMAHN